MIGFIINMSLVVLWIVLGVVVGEMLWPAIIISLFGALFCLGIDTGA